MKLYKSRSGRVVYGDANTNKGIELVGERYNSYSGKENLKPTFQNKTWNIRGNFKEIENASITFENIKDIPSNEERLYIVNHHGKKRIRPSFATGLVKKFKLTGEILEIYIFMYSPTRDEVSYFHKELARPQKGSSFDISPITEPVIDPYISLHQCTYNQFKSFMEQPPKRMFCYEKIDQEKITLKF